MEHGRVEILEREESPQGQIHHRGDDIDGVCSTYITYRGLKRLGAAVDYEIPDRVKGQLLGSTSPLSWRYLGSWVDPHSDL